MKILATGDLHLRVTSPKNRTDDYPTTLFEKFKHICMYALDNNINYIIVPGDMFDTPKVPFRLILDIYTLFKDINTYGKTEILAVYGQHDLYFHSLNVENTPMRFLEHLGIVKRLTPTPLKIDGWNFYGASWGENIPNVEGTNNVLVTHKMVIGDEKLWPGQEDYITAESLLRDYEYKLIVSGDNHRQFTKQHRNRWVVNCGAVGRSVADEYNQTHKPCFYVYDTKTMKLKQEFIPIKSYEDVFDVKSLTHTREVDEALADFIERLQGDSAVRGLDFKSNLMHYINSNECSDGVSTHINNSLTE